MKSQWMKKFLFAILVAIAFPAIFASEVSAKERALSHDGGWAKEINIDQQGPKLIVSDSGVTIIGDRVKNFQIVVGPVPYRSTIFSPILLNGEWWNYQPSRADTLWYKINDGIRWWPTVDGKGLYGPVKADTLFFLRQGVNSVREILDNPQRFILYQNFPNPFNPTTTVEYVLPKSSEVVLTVYNNIGQVVATLFNGQQNAGYHKVFWNASQNSAGIYFLELKAGEFRKVIKMNLLK